MNYKFSDRIDSKYAVLSYFHQGLFWGIILAWIAVISGISGAAIASFVVLDKREEIVVKNSSLVVNPSSLDSYETISLEKTKTPYFTLTYGESLKSHILERGKMEFARNRFNQFFFDTNYSLVTNLSFESNIALLQFSPTVNDSAIIDISFQLFSDRDRDFKNLKIVIQNTTENPILTTQVSSYLKERGFENIIISTNKIFPLNHTMITTNSQNSAAANYVQTTLNMGILDFSQDTEGDRFTKSELLIQLGDDARLFARNHNFIYYEE